MTSSYLPMRRRFVHAYTSCNQVTTHNKSLIVEQNCPLPSFMFSVFFSALMALRNDQLKERSLHTPSFYVVDVSKRQQVGDFLCCTFLLHTVRPFCQLLIDSLVVGYVGTACEKSSSRGGQVTFSQHSIRRTICVVFLRTERTRCPVNSGQHRASGQGCDRFAFPTES